MWESAVPYASCTPGTRGGVNCEYECTDSDCVYTGCNSNDECVESHGAGWDCI